MIQEAHVTSQQMWSVARVTAVIDIVFVAILIWRIKRTRFRQSLGPLVVVSAAFWTFTLWLPVWSYWTSCYGYIFPDWVRWITPIYGLVIGALLAPLFWWLGVRLPGHPVLTVAILGGLHSLPGHMHGIYGRDMLEKCPLLVDVSAASALVFGVFEFIFYWCVVLTLTALIVSMREHWRRRRREGTMPAHRT